MTEQPDEGVELGAGQAVEQAPEPVLQQLAGRCKARAPCIRERQRLTAAVVDQALPLEQPGRLEVADQLGDGGRRDGGPARELPAEHVAGIDRLEHEVLGDRQRG